MKKPRPVLAHLCCLHAQCKAYGQRGQAHRTGRKPSGADRIGSVRYQGGGEAFSQRKGTALFNCPIGQAQAIWVLEPVDRG